MFGYVDIGSSDLPHNNLHVVVRRPQADVTSTDLGPAVLRAAPFGPGYSSPLVRRIK